MWFKHRSDKIEELRKVPLFAHLSSRDLDQVARIAEEVQAEPGKVLMRRGEPGRDFILIVDGKVRIDRDGQTIAQCGPGTFIGEMALLDGKGRSATAITEEPTTMLVIRWGRFWPMLETIPGVQRKLLIGLASRIREVEARADQLT